jgi:hypothetical protein
MKRSWRLAAVALIAAAVVGAGGVAPAYAALTKFADHVEVPENQYIVSAATTVTGGTAWGHSTGMAYWTVTMNSSGGIVASANATGSKASLTHPAVSGGRSMCRWDYPLGSYGGLISMVCERRY